MPRVTIATLRALVRELVYSIAVHAADELEDDNLSILDLETIVLSGTIVERRRDRKSGETKYVIRGTSLDGQEGECIAKIGPTGRLFVITVHLD